MVGQYPNTKPLVDVKLLMCRNDANDIKQRAFYISLSAKFDD